MTRRALLVGTVLAVLAALHPPVGAVPPGQETTLRRYAADTWRSFERLVVPRTGLPADKIGGDLDPATRVRFTSPTNIAMYLWSTLAARDLGLIGRGEATARIARVLETLGRLERHEPSGQFYNWYDPVTLEKIAVWPDPPHHRVYPFLSSVDNGWLASALVMVANAVPGLAQEARGLVSSIDFRCYYDPFAKGAGPGGEPLPGGGLIRGGFWRVEDAPPWASGFPRGDYCGMGETVVYTGHHYGAFNTEPRIASYLGIAMGQLPPDHYFAGWRTFPDDCGWSWQEQKPVGQWRTYLGARVYEGAYRYDDQLVVPSWGGSMFEALMVPLVVPEEQWGPRSWAITHPLYVESQVEYGLEEAGYGYWGFSPASDPAADYREYGVDQIGMWDAGYTSDQQRGTLVDLGWPDPACSRAPRAIEDYGNGVVTPHAAFLALDFARREALDNLAALEADFPGLYGPGGFRDSVDVVTGQVADRYLALDQGMVMAAVANDVLNDRLQGYLAPFLEPSLRPLMGMEEFGAGRTPP